MSLVGTRPPTVDEWELYEPHHRARMSFRPGLTGMWQVSGRSNITDFEEVVKLDTQELIDGKLVCGAGGGGFLQVILKKGVTKQQVENRLKADLFSDL